MTNSYEFDQNKGVYALIDNYTCMFSDVTINDVFKWLRVDPEAFYGDLYHNRALIQSISAYQFSWNGINIQAFDLAAVALIDSAIRNNETISDEFDPNSDDFINVFELTLNKIRLELTGTGLAYLRSQLPDIDDYLRDLRLKHPCQKVTRVDFAFDFVNYMPDILDAVIEYAQSFSVNGRVLTYGGRGYKCQVTTVDQKKVYLGSPQSDKMLRIYDKRIEQLDSNREVYRKPNNYNNPSSWIRFEFQLRNDKARELCYLASSDSVEYNLPSLFAIFRKLMNDYTFIDPDTTKNNRSPYEPWLDLWDWVEVEQLYKMQDSDQTFVPYDDRLKKYIEDICISNITVYIDKFGIQQLFAAIFKYLSYMDSEDEFYQRTKARLSMKLAMAEVTDHKLLRVDRGKYELNEKLKFLFLSSSDILNSEIDIKEELL